MISRRGKLSMIAGVMTVSVLSGVPAMAEYPDRAITVIVPTKAGGGVDSQARALTAVMESDLGQPLNIVNKPGAGGTVGLQQLKTMRPDGYTIAMAASVSFIQNPITQGLAFGVKDLTVIGTTGTFQTALVASGKAPFSNWQEFVAYAKAHPGTRWYSVGNASSLIMKAIAKAEGLDIVIVPGVGGATIAPTLFAGDADISLSGGVHTKFLPSGDLQVLLSTLPWGKLLATPEVPNSQKLYGVSLVNTMTVLSPVGVPANILAKLESAVENAAKSNTYAALMDKIKFPVTYKNSAGSTADYLAFEAGFKTLMGN